MGINFTIYFNKSSYDVIEPLERNLSLGGPWRGFQAELLDIQANDGKIGFL